MLGDWCGVLGGGVKVGCGCCYGGCGGSGMCVVWGVGLDVCVVWGVFCVCVWVGVG